MKRNNQKPPLKVKLIVELDKNGKANSYLANSKGRKLDIQLNNISVSKRFIPIYLHPLGEIDRKLENIEIEFKGVIKQ